MKSKVTIESCAALLAALLSLLVSCVGTEGGPGQSLWDGVCTTEREGWEKCDSNRIQWCHILEGMTPHFHEGLNCQALGLTCVEQESAGGGLTGYEAFCVDESMTCQQGAYACVDNTARNCVGGVTALAPCGTQVCDLSGGEAVCRQDTTEECGGHGQLVDGACQCDDTYEQDPDDPADCVSSYTFPQRACYVFNQGRDSIPLDHQLDATNDRPGPHAHVDEVMQVRLLAAHTSNYVHFPVTQTGEYVLFLDTAGVVTNVYDADGLALPMENPGANGMCADVLADHFHISTTYTGDGSSAVPAIVEFQVAQDTTVKLLVMFEDEEHEE